MTVAVTPVGSVPYPSTSPAAAFCTVTVADDNFCESRSVIETTGDTRTAVPDVPTATGVTTSNGGVATTMTEATPPTRLCKPLSSFTVIEAIRGAPPCVVENEIACSAASYCASVADPDKVRIFVVAFHCAVTGFPGGAV